MRSATVKMFNRRACLIHTICSLGSKFNHFLHWDPNSPVSVLQGAQFEFNWPHFFRNSLQENERCISTILIASYFKAKLIC